MTISFTGYTEGEGASHALVGDLTAQLADQFADPVATGEGWAVYRADGGGTELVDWRHLGDRPHRRAGTSTLTDPHSFGELVLRLAVGETTIWADRSAQRITAVFNDHPASETKTPTGAPSATEVTAGYGDHTAVLALESHEDWNQWTHRNGSMAPQREFGEFIEEMAHTIVIPDAATMLEVATSLTMRRSIDFGSRTRLDNGDTEFRFVEESVGRAGRGQDSIEIPSVFTIETPVWQGGEPVRIDARLRYRATGDGVAMGYKMIRRTDAMDLAFGAVLNIVSAAGPGWVPTFLGAAPTPSRGMR